MATTAPHRVWEENKPSPPPGDRQLPSISALTSNLPPGNSAPSPTSTRERDSGAWSSRPESTRSSTYSTGTSAYLSSNTNSYYMSPNRASQLSSNSYTGGHASADYSVDRNSHGPLSSPPINGHTLPSLNSVHESTIKEEGREYLSHTSRRSSIGSQLNQGVGQLHLGGLNSPYSASVNHSQTSLAQSLNAQRGIPSHGLRTSHSSAQLQRSPPTSNMPEARPQTSSTRQAPPIGNIPGREIVSGQEPVKGQAYAFPDFDNMIPGDLPPNRSISNRSHASTEDIRLGSMTRRGSGHTSLASSTLTADSHLPPGQHRLDETMSGHTSIRNSTMSDVAEDDSMTPEENHTPYSRTPALRVSHKMAERKRRSEMKDLFENLRSQIPSNQGSKSSKWEILSKASDYIKQLEQQAQHGPQVDHRLRAALQEMEMSRNQENALREENQRLLNELQRLRQGSGPPPQHGPPQAVPPGPPPPQAGSLPPPPHGLSPPHPSSSGFTPQNYVPPPPPPPPLHNPTRSLPPLGGVPSGPPPPAPPGASTSMEGVRYS